MAVKLQHRKLNLSWSVNLDGGGIIFRAPQRRIGREYLKGFRVCMEGMEGREGRFGRSVGLWGREDDRWNGEDGCGLGNLDVKEGFERWWRWQVYAS